jgi:SAM-dependent methyltransferase
MTNAASTDLIQAVDAHLAEQFAGRLVSVLNSGALALMVSIGHRAGLFDTLANAGAVTAAELAAMAGKNERYVREWLGAMVVGGIVTLTPESGRYLLPRAHAAHLTRDAGSDNIAVYAQYIGLLGSVESRIVDCFTHGGGVPYAEFHRFHEVMSEDSGITVLPALVDRILPIIPQALTRLAQGIHVLDIGCGSGRALNLLGRTFPRSTFTGFDFSEEAVERARREAFASGANNVRFECRDVATSLEENAYDLIFAFDAVHDQAAPARVLSNVARALRPGGTFLMQDIRGTSHHHEDASLPLAPLLYAVSCMHCMTVSLAQGGEGLGAMWGEAKAREYLAQAGFSDVAVFELPHDIQNLYYVCRRR